MVFMNDWRANLSPAEILAAEQAAGRAAVAKAEAEAQAKLARLEAERERRKALRAPIMEKALAKLVSSRDERMKRALATFEEREARLEKYIRDGAESSSGPFVTAMRRLGLNPKGDPLQPWKPKPWKPKLRDGVGNGL
jgi:hypothetical protein